LIHCCLYIMSDSMCIVWSFTYLCLEISISCSRGGCERYSFQETENFSLLTFNSSCTKRGKRHYLLFILSFRLHLLMHHGCDHNSNVFRTLFLTRNLFWWEKFRSFSSNFAIQSSFCSNFSQLVLVGLLSSQVLLLQLKKEELTRAQPL